ncbi:MAG: hypothetical protein H6623_05330 [Bdellovibrionaceae bacterium]|nr:hypothetical protein [Pseudobdellovibrionaceae bacterium]
MIETDYRTMNLLAWTIARSLVAKKRDIKKVVPDLGKALKQSKKNRIYQYPATNEKISISNKLISKKTKGGKNENE